jgi:hypothetical protein
MEYFLLLLIPLLLGAVYLNPEYRALYRVLIGTYFLLLIAFSGLRWTTGTDWENYIEYFNTQDNYRYFEQGYVLVTGLVKLFTNSYTAFLIIDAALALIPVWYVLKRHDDCHPLSVALFFSYYFTLNYLGSNRRIISIGICLLALLFLKRKKLIPFVLLCILAFFFHRSALIFLFAWPVYHAKPAGRKYVLLIFAAIVIQVANPLSHIESLLGSTHSDLVLIERVLDYSENDSLNPNINYGLQDTLAIVKRCVFLIVIYWGWSKQSEAVKKAYSGYLNLYVFSVFLYLLFTGSGEIFKTVTIYFGIVEILLLPIALLSFKQYRPVVYCLLFAILFAQQYSALNSYWDLYMPYRSVLADRR